MENTIYLFPIDTIPIPYHAEKPETSNRSVFPPILVHTQ